MIQKENIIWAAGFFDGEGCVTIRKRLRPIKIYYDLFIKITNTNKESVYKFKKLFTYGSIHSRKTITGKIAWEWCISGEKALNILNILKPFTVVKTEQINVAIEFQSMTGVKKTEKEWKERENLYFKMRSLK